ncbi:MAG: HEAT repeat domain-containing protein [Verrucomicrobiota bacterium]|jgi:HEAT repeat protein
MMTSLAKPPAAGLSSLPRTRRAAWAVWVFVLLLHPPSSNAQPVTNPPGLSLEIRCTNTELKVGDEIPIQFIISNHGTADFQFEDQTEERFGRNGQCLLSAKTASGDIVPPYPQSKQRSQDGLQNAFHSRFINYVLHPGESFTRIQALNLPAFIKEPGRYEVAGTWYLGASGGTTVLSRLILRRAGAELAGNVGASGGTTLTSAPITITVSPRSKEEMDDYVTGLTNQIAARLVPRAVNSATQYDPDLERLLLKLAYTGSPELLPALLRSIYGPANEGVWVDEMLMYYLPRTEETGKAIFEAAAAHGLHDGMEYLLNNYDLLDTNIDKKKEGKEVIQPLIQRALASSKPAELRVGAELAAYACYDDSFTPSLIAIAVDSEVDPQSRSQAIEALALNRTDAGVSTLNTLLNDPTQQLWGALAAAIERGYATWPETPTGRHLQPGDFSSKELWSFIERWLSSNPLPGEKSRIESLAGLCVDDALTPKLAALATDPAYDYRAIAIYALAFNRTDLAISTLKTLLNDPDPNVSFTTKRAIYYAYKSRGPSRNLAGGVPRGKPLRPTDFDADLQHP